MQENTSDMKKTIVNIDGAKCIGCGSCKRNCRFLAIYRGKEYYIVDQIKCIGCGECMNKCPADAIAYI